MNPIIMPTGETKNFLDFMEVNTERKFCVNKTSFIKTVEEFRYWTQNNFGTDFSSKLFSLMSKADCYNMQKFLTGFIAETIVFLLWQQASSSENFFEQWGNIEIKDPEVTPENLIINPSSNFIEDLKIRYNRQKYIQDREAIYGDKN